LDLFLVGGLQILEGLGLADPPAFPHFPHDLGARTEGSDLLHDPGEAFSLLGLGAAVAGHGSLPLLRPWGQDAALEPVQNVAFEAIEDGAFGLYWGAYDRLIFCRMPQHPGGIVIDGVSHGS
jgi:hypothetical protein